jgi:hypothetical protein
MADLLLGCNAGVPSYRGHMGALVSPQKPLKNAEYGQVFRYGGHTWSGVPRRVARMQRTMDFSDGVLHERPAARMRKMPATARASGRGMQAI